MNLLRPLSRHHRQCLRWIASGEYVVTWEPEERRWVERYRRYRGGYSESYSVILPSKPRGSRLIMCHGHWTSSIVELLQRGLLVDEGGRLVPSREARRVFGTPEALPAPVRACRRRFGGSLCPGLGPRGTRDER